MRAPSGKLNREQQIKLGLQLLKVAPQEDVAPQTHTKWQQRLERALDEMDEAHGLAAMYKSKQSKDVTKARSALNLALKKLQIAERDLRELGWTPLPIDDKAIAQSIADTAPLPPKVTLQPYGPYGAFAKQDAPRAMLAHRDAVKLAHRLLTQRGARIVTTRKGDWHRFAAILYGDTDADLFQHLRRYLQEQKQGL